MKNAQSILFTVLALVAGISCVNAADLATGKGTVNKIDTAAGSVNMTHEAIPALKWPAMTMDIRVADKKVLNGIKSGQTVTFGLTKMEGSGYVISHIEAAK